MIKDHVCIHGHSREVFFSVRANQGCETIICQCGATMAPVFTPCAGRSLWIEEGRARTFYNIAHEPITVTSRKQYREALKKHGVAEAGAIHKTDSNMHSGKVTLTAKGRWI